MLQTTTNQLTLKQKTLKHRQLIIDELTIAGYEVTDKNNDDSTNIINYSLRDINDDITNVTIGLDIHAHPESYINKESLKLEDAVNIIVVFCNQFTDGDIQAISKFYMHICDKNLQDIPEVIETIDGKTLEPGQLSEIISEYLTTEEY